VGWCSRRTRAEKLVLAAESATLCPPTINQLIVSRYLSHARLAGPIKLYRETYGERRDPCCSAMEQHLPRGCHGPRRDGGFYFWLTVAGRRGHQGELRAVTARVAYASGTGFYATGSAAGSCACRLLPAAEADPEGVRRLANVLSDEMELFGRRFGGSPVGAGPQSRLPTRPDRYGVPTGRPSGRTVVCETRHVSDTWVAVLSGGLSHETLVPCGPVGAVGRLRLPGDRGRVGRDANLVARLPGPAAAGRG